MEAARTDTAIRVRSTLGKPKTVRYPCEDASWSSRVADAVVWACTVLSWALSCVQIYSAWLAWRHHNGMYGMPGALSIVYYLPLVGIYICAVGFASRRRLGTFAIAPVIGILALSLV
jgi:hypothetical protein